MTHWKLYLCILMAAGAALQHSVTGDSMTANQWIVAVIGALTAAGAAATAYFDTTVADHRA